MKNIIFSFVFILLAIVTSGQQKVALHRGSDVEIFSGASPFVDAYNAAAAGDVIYLPGGNLPFPPVIDKGITIIGAGHYPGATSAMNKTTLIGSLSIYENADNLVLEGLEITGSISFAYNQKVDNVVIKRCRINVIGYGGNGLTPCVNNTIKECIIDNVLDLTNARGSLVTNNIISYSINNCLEIGITNNLFLFSGPLYIFNNVNNSNISNNIILQQYAGSAYIQTSCALSTFSNNIFSSTPAVGTSTFINNYTNSGISSLFVSQTGNAFNYTDNYHLVNPTTYLGTDGNQIGIYGGLFPFKDLSIPVNPQIQNRFVSPMTNTTGEINIQFQVKAQNN